MKLKITNKKLERIMRLLPDMLVYHYFGWQFNTQNYDLPERLAELDCPHQMKNVLWYNDIHDGIVHQVGETIRELYYQQDTPREVLTIQ